MVIKIDKFKSLDETLHNDLYVATMIPTPQHAIVLGNNGEVLDFVSEPSVYHLGTETECRLVETLYTPRLSTSPAQQMLNQDSPREGGGAADGTF